MLKVCPIFRGTYSAYELQAHSTPAYSIYTCDDHYQKYNIVHSSVQHSTGVE